MMDLVHMAVDKFKIMNWAEYDADLRRRGSMPFG